ncbi:uncharacterized protein LOC121857768 [Homarus americanus]|uniref:uncharacterized protein LOC121857768 n=1 Tax=Homarus americanus TaxID=6706 RepID=UPI001C480278|nr:uncharacterized protein LOC121857768 [Homarus americanus]
MLDYCGLLLLFYLFFVILESISDLYFIIIFPEHMQIDMFLLLANTTTLALILYGAWLLQEERAACVTWLKEELLYTEDYTVLARGWWLVREMQQTSGPSILGFFTLGNHCIVSVCSFVATYLVILLQFQISPSTSQPSPTSSTNVSTVASTTF